MFSIDKLLKLDKNLFEKQRLFFGILLVCMGMYLIWDNIRRIIESYIDPVYTYGYNVRGTCSHSDIYEKGGTGGI
ncbi:hypothetical protein AB8U03_17605 [Clostridium sp. Mt-5]|uniref:Uncharacterized protein n=1 Tax=Clostridium moutaii TaxID=3240932 RepID=A0ABV4BT82_9CLOT